MSKSITLPLTEYLEALLGCKPYSVVSVECGQRIVHADQDRAIAVVENSPDTYGMSNNPLPQLSANLCRVWLRKDWELCDNRRRECNARIEQAHAAYNDKLRRIITYFVATGISESMAETVVKGMTQTTIEAMIVSIEKELK